MPPQYTPAQIADMLAVSPSSTRRMAATFESVMGPLPRTAQGARVWPLEAFRQLEAAHNALTTSGGRVTSLDHALRLIRDGQELPERVTLPDRPDPLTELLAEVRALRVLTEAQGRELAQLREAVQTFQALPAPPPDAQGATDPPDAGQAAVKDAVGDAVRAALDPERLRVALHATDPGPARPRGFLARLFGGR